MYKAILDGSGVSVCDNFDSLIAFGFGSNNSSIGRLFLSDEEVIFYLQTQIY